MNSHSAPALSRDGRGDSRREVCAPPPAVHLPAGHDATAAVVEVPLTQGLCALVDAADAPLVLSAGPWYAMRNRRNCYAMRTGEAGEHYGEFARPNFPRH